MSDTRCTPNCGCQKATLGEAVSAIVRTHGDEMRPETVVYLLQEYGFEIRKRPDGES